MTNMASIAAASMAYLSIPVPSRIRLDAGLDSFESGIGNDSPDYPTLAKQMSELSATIGIRTSSGEICEEFLAERREQVLRIFERAATSNNPGTALPPLHELITEAYAAAALTRDESVAGDPSSLYRRLMKWWIEDSSDDSRRESIEVLRGLLKEVTDEAFAYVSRYRGAALPEVPGEEGGRTNGGSTPR